jgi:hypothetical protein
MTLPYRISLLAGILGLLVSVAPLANAQQANPSSAPSGTKNGQTAEPSSPAYQMGYQQGLKDGKASEPSPVASGWKDDADRRAYTDGYHAGYCREEKTRTGYYNGVYGYGPPVIRNGYYGYNAPDAYCEEGRKTGPQSRRDPQAPQNRVEYAGGGS